MTLDTTHILEGGAVEDTRNLLADEMLKLMPAVAEVEHGEVRH